jgi:hypothetical protein
MTDEKYYPFTRSLLPHYYVRHACGQWIVPEIRELENQKAWRFKATCSTIKTAKD